MARDREAAAKDYATQKEALAKVAYGGDASVAWNAGAKPNINLDNLVKLASEKKLFDIDDSALRSQLADFKIATQTLQSAHDAAGLVMDSAELEFAKALSQRAAFTCVEVGLLSLVKDPIDKDKAPLQVQTLVKELRSEKLHEKRVLNESLYRWAFQVITGRQ